MNDSTKKASAITFTLLVLLGVGMLIMFAVNHIAEGNLIVRDVKEGDATLRRLFVADVAHAGQFLPPSNANDRHTVKDFSRLPVLYWHPEGPVGAVLAKFNWLPGRRNTWHADVRLPASLAGMGLSHGPLPANQLVAAWSEPPIAALPMKAGALAGYARPLQIVDFYEPNAGVHELSFPKMGDAKFTFVRDALQRGANVRVFQGKERELLAKQAPRGFYRALFVDTVRGDMSELAEDLLTREGLAALMATTTEDGILGFHVSNRELDVAPLIADSAESLKLVTVMAEDRGEGGKGHYHSEWVFVARRGVYLHHLNRSGGAIRWSVLASRGRYQWTDAGKRDRTGLLRKKD